MRHMYNPNERTHATSATAHIFKDKRANEMEELS